MGAVQSIFKDPVDKAIGYARSWNATETDNELNKVNNAGKFLGDYNTQFQAIIATNANNALSVITQLDKVDQEIADTILKTLASLSNNIVDINKSMGTNFGIIATVTMPGAQQSMVDALKATMGDSLKGLNTMMLALKDTLDKVIHNIGDAQTLIDGMSSMIPNLKRALDIGINTATGRDFMVVRMHKLALIDAMMVGITHINNQIYSHPMLNEALNNFRHTSTIKMDPPNLQVVRFSLEWGQANDEEKVRGALIEHILNGIPDWVIMELNHTPTSASFTTTSTDDQLQVYARIISAINDFTNASGVTVNYIQN